VWDIGFKTGTNVVDVVVRRLRAKVDDPFKTKLIQTIRGSAMFSKPTERRSIAWQLILLFTVATSFLLACGLGLFYAIVVRHAFAEDNAVLADKIAALRTDLYESGPNVFAKELKGRHAGSTPLIGSGCSIRKAALTRKRREWTDRFHQRFSAAARLSVDGWRAKGLPQRVEAVFARRCERRVWQPALHASASTGPVKRRATRKKLRCLIHHSPGG